MTARARTGTRSSESGMIAVAILVVLVVALIGGAIAATVAWQSATVTTHERQFAAANMAANAMTAALESASQIDPRANPTLDGYPTSEPAWIAGPQPNQQYRWWLSTTAVPSVIEVTAHGRAGVGTAAVEEYSARLRFDYNQRRWVPQVVRAQQ